MTAYFHPLSKLARQKSYIDGQYIDSTSGEVFETLHPGNKSQICEVEVAGENEVNLAVESALRGFEEWSGISASARSKILFKAAHILTQRNQELAELETLDTGKSVSETTVTDILSGVEVLEFYAGLAPTIGGDHMDFPGEGHAIMKREPLGVCLGIGAWNYPIQIALWKSSLALACGNSMIFKPSEYTPLTALKLAEIYSQAGLPDGVFNVIQGGSATGKLLVDHPLINKVSLTGSVGTGKKIMAQAAGSLKKVTLELGGKSPILVFNDANIENAVNAIVPANFYSTGQVCSNGTRVFVQKGIYAELLSALEEQTKRIIVGNPFNENTDMGPLVSQMQYDKVIAYMDDARASKARLICGGKAYSDESMSAGYFVPPTILADCTDDMKFVREEVFGPLMSVLSFNDEDEVLERANSSEFGLAGAVFTQDLTRANRVANALQAGSVWINNYHILPASVPFGGYKASGIGRENGKSAIEHYTQIKMIYTSLSDIEPCY